VRGRVEVLGLRVSNVGMRVYGRVCKGCHRDELSGLIEGEDERGPDDDGPQRASCWGFQFKNN